MRSDDGGQEWLGEVRLLPYRLPLTEIDATLARLQQGDTFLAYDPDLGWAPRPYGRSTAGPFRANGSGIRADDETALEAAPGVLRVALFGDSFTFGDEVASDQTWGALLARDLAARGVAAEVLNFGVNAYGMDQAYLRWRRDGRRFRPDVVIYGFQPENALRNLNVFRPLYFAGTEVPLSKPRFVIDDDELVTVNVPTVPPAEMSLVLATLDDQPLLAYERYGARYARHWWLRSKLAAALAAFATSNDDDAALRIDDESAALALRVTEVFSRDVAQSGAAFLIVELPRRPDIEAWRASSPLWYGGLLQSLSARFTVVDPTAGLAAIDDRPFEPHGHYAPALNEAVAAALVEPALTAAAAGTRLPH